MAKVHEPFTLYAEDLKSKLLINLKKSLSANSRLIVGDKKGSPNLL